MEQFNRKIISHLKRWADSKDRKPLILRGARQVGKTTAVNIFSKQFDPYVYLDLEKSEVDFPQYRGHTEKFDIISNLEVYYGRNERS